MLILESTATLQGITDADSQITVTVYGLDNDGSGGVTYKKLYQGQPAAAGTTLLTVATGHTYLVKSITVVNTDTVNSHTVKLWHGGNAATNIILPITTLSASEHGFHGDSGWQFYTATGATKGVGAPGLNGAVLGIYGDGSDGALDFTTVGGTIGGATRATLTYTATRDIFASSIIIEPTVILNMAQYRLFCTGTITNNGVISCDGGNGTLSVGGVAQSRGSVAPLTGAGATGVSSGTTTVAGTAGTTSGSTSALFAPGKVLGNGGNGGAGGNAGGAGATLSSLVLGATLTPRDVVSLATALLFTPGVTATTGPTMATLCGGSGGGSGARTVGTTATVSGGGGAGGGVLLIMAKTIINSSGIIRANGGNGANATGAGDCVTGGGGGGGGGTVIMIYSNLTPGTEQANGGTKGTGLNGAAAAVDGLGGVVIKVPC